MPTRSRYDAVFGTMLTAANLDKHPGGWVGYVSTAGATGSITTTSTDVSTLTLTFTAEVDRVYRITADLEVTSTVAGDVFVMNVTDGSNVNQHRATGVVAAANTNQTVHTTFFQSGISGSVTRKCRMVRAAGTGSLTAGAGAGDIATLIIEDMGPV